ncbi:signal transduction histidine kinase [Friedmanniella endophytica]|uniref:histidine kinase n=1 Tax=Microlunatus kandeliicorticis TaxID=1759536 RepID=A0A7W3P740_9ACTN|nr:ATP-binding protein [Microlunatus kandeliicorticis]MBA8795706.1 signal transduction histidine kinase [Microlunatus kandeliicorticis]
MSQAATTSTPDRTERPTRVVLGVRQQSVLSAVVVVGLALLAGGGLLLFALQSALTNTTRGALEARARDVAILASEQGLRAVGSELQRDRIRGQEVQILDGQGAVVATSDQRLAAALAPGLHPSTGQYRDLGLTGIAQIGDEDDYLVVAYGFERDRQPYVVQVAGSIQIQSDTIRTVGLLLVGGAPLLLVVVAVAVWVLVGRSLGAVDRIRKQVARIDGARLNERVPVPPSRDEIELLAATMNTMLDRIEASDRAQRAFVSDASHELRSPISTLVITGEVAAADPTGRTWVEMQDIVLDESRRMRALVEDLLVLAKVDAQGLALRQVEVDLDDLLDIEVRRLRKASGLTVRSDLVPARVTGDPDRLGQVIRNVADNAVRHAVSTIAVAVRTDQVQAVITIDNDGPPIAPAERGRIFQRFVRLDDARDRDSGGSGLGLAISAAIVDAHHGRIETGETEQGWCRFAITLPLAEVARYDPETEIEEHHP